MNGLLEEYQKHGPVRRMDGEPDVEKKVDWICWAARHYGTTDYSWLHERWAVTALYGQQPLDSPNTH